MKTLDTIRQEFSPLTQDIIYFDSGASTLTPNSVVEAMDAYYTQYRSNIHRGIYAWSQQSTDKYELARLKVAQFIQANQVEEIIFTRGTTDSINMIAELLINTFQKGQNIIIPVTEHHSNMLPWRELAQRQELEIRYAGLRDEILDIEELMGHIDENTALVVIGHVSNVLGSIHPIQEIAHKAHSVGALCVVDGAQSVAHIPISVSELGVDAYAFSGHKVYGSTGVGVLWVKYELLQTLTPSRTGGDMVSYVTLDTVEYAPIPQRFEAGTPPIAEVIGLSKAIDWLQEIGWDTIQEHEKKLIDYMWGQISLRPWIHVLGGDKTMSRIGCFAFTIQGIHTHDIAHMLAQHNVCVRAGQHCASGIAETLDIVGSTRITFGLYNTVEEIDICMQALDSIYKTFN